MPYTPKDWADGPSGGTPITAADLDHLETQHAQAVADAAAAPVKAHTHPAADIASGVLAPARLGSGSASGSTVLRGDSSWGAPPATAPAPHTHPAADIVSGLLAAARLGTGTADATTFLRGDATWQPPPAGGGGGVTGSVQFSVARNTEDRPPLMENEFLTYPLDGTPSVNVGGGSWNNTVWIYTVPAAGLYLCLGGVRQKDGQPARSLAVGIGTDNGDGPHVYWSPVGGTTPEDQRGMVQYTRIARFSAGAQVRLFIYSALQKFYPQWEVNNTTAGQYLSLIKLAD